MSIFRHIAVSLDTPAARNFRLPRPHSADFGRWSENVARYFGTSRYLVTQTAIVAAWIAINAIPVLTDVRWDPYPFILLNLAFSTQAAYAAPLILLAQNRQAERDRVQIEADRVHVHMQRETTDFISTEIAALRVTQGAGASRDFVRLEVARQLAELRAAVRDDVRCELSGHRCT